MPPLVIAGVVAAGATIGGSVISAKAAGSAADKQAAAADAASQVQWNMYSQGRTDLAPYRAMGTPALQALAQAMGLGNLVSSDTADPVAAEQARLKEQIAKLENTSIPKAGFKSIGLKAKNMATLAALRGKLESLGPDRTGEYSVTPRALTGTMPPQQGYVAESGGYAPQGQAEDISRQIQQWENAPNPGRNAAEQEQFERQKQATIGNLKAQLKNAQESPVSNLPISPDTNRLKALQDQMGGIPGIDFGYLTEKSPEWDFQYDPNEDPGTQFRLEEGRKMRERSAAARTGTLSGAAAKEMERYGQEFGSQEYQNSWNRSLQEYLTKYNVSEADKANLFNRLMAIAGLGSGATNVGVNMGQQTAQDVAGNIIGAGNAQAAGTIGAGNVWGNTLANVGGNLGNLYMLQKSLNQSSYNPTDPYLDQIYAGTAPGRYSL